MDELEQIVKQVQMLRDSVEMMLTRSEQLFKMQEERLSVLPQLAEDLHVSIDEIQTTDEALKESLNDQDGAIDDLKKSVAALLLIQSQQNAKNASQPPASGA